MSQDAELALSRFRQGHQPTFNQRDKTTPISQQVISWGIVLIYVFLVCDHEAWKNAFREREEEGAFPGSPVYEQALQSLEETKGQFKELVGSGEISPKEAARLQYQGIGFYSQMGQDWRDFSTLVVTQAEEAYAKKWQPDERDQWMKIHIKTEGDRVSYAKMDFHRKFQEAQMALPRPQGLEPIDIGWDDFLRLGIWIIKWYYLMVIPVLLIVLIGKRYEGVSVKEEIILQPSRLGWACLGGPIALFGLSETAAKVHRYRKLEQQLLSQKPWGYRLSEKERQALWVQVYEPMKSFDEALGSLTHAGQQIRRPATVCFVAWILSLSFSQTMMNRVMPQVVVSSQIQDEDGSEKLDPPSPKDDTPSFLAILPAPVVWQENEEEGGEAMPIAQPAQRCCWNPDQPRGPPSLVREQHAKKTLCLSELAIVTEG